MFILNPGEYSLLARHGMLPPGSKESTRVPGEQAPVSVVPNRRDRRRAIQMARGKPKPGGKKDRRLKRNRRRKK